MKDFNVQFILNDKRNVEDIHRKNLEDNQLFFEQLRMTDIRNDFVKSAHSIIPKNETRKYTKHSYEKVERVTRYSLKVKSGEIQPSIPQWQQKDNNKKKGQLSKWTVIYKNNAAPYQRIFKPRNTRIGARVEQELMRLKKKQNNS